MMCGRRQAQGAACSRVGFTLTELAIVLGIASILLGGVWVMADRVWVSYRVNTVQEQMVTVVRNMRNAYALRNAGAAPFNVNNADITTRVDQDGLIPVEMRENRSAAGGNIHHAISSGNTTGTFHVVAKPNGVGNVFRIRLLDLPVESCIKLVMQMPLDMPEMGAVTLAVVQGTTTNAVTINAQNVTNPGNGTNIPLDVETAGTFCKGGRSEVRIDFKLRL